MAKYLLSHKAVVDLSDIWRYTYENWSEKQADKYYLLLLDSCKVIAGRPETGRKYEHVHPGLRGYNAYQHIIFYIARDKYVEIVRILHSRMDIEARMND
jgi:toxin ParE1/3/4